MTHEEQVEELRKCKESRAYFYNKYVKRPEDPEITEEYIKRMEFLANPFFRRVRNPSLLIDKLINSNSLPEHLRK